MTLTMRISTALAVLAGALGAQSPKPLVIEGQTFDGSGTVTGIRYVHVDNSGGWLVQVSTDEPQSPSAVIRKPFYSPGASLWKQIGDGMEDPARARVAEFDSFASEALGAVLWNVRLRDTLGGTTDDQALYFEHKLWLQEGPIEAWLTTDFPQGSRWISFDDVRCPLQDGALLLRGRADDPTVPGSDETFAAFGTLCGSYGVLCSLDRIAQEGLPAPATGQLIESVRLEPAAAVMGPSTKIVWSCDLAGPEASDGCIYTFNAMTWQHTLLAQEGSPSPVAGRNWGPLDHPGMHINWAGDWTLRATLDASDLASDAIIVKNDTVVIREGDTLPAIAPYTFEDFGRGRALIDNDGHVVWYGRWNEPGGSSEALFRDDKILVRAGLTTVEGRLLLRLSFGPDDVALTPEGDQLIFKGTLAGGLEGAFTLDLSGMP